MAKGVKDATEADLLAAVCGDAPSLKKYSKKSMKAAKKIVKAAKKECKASGILVKRAKPEPVNRAAEEWRVLSAFQNSPDPTVRAMYREVMPDPAHVGARKFDEIVRKASANPFDGCGSVWAKDPMLYRLYEQAVRKI